MMHAKRRWGVGPAASAEELARMLTQSTWTLCSGFYVEGHPNYLFLNDATHEDGAAEYAVVRGGLDAKEHVQIESITFSWCTYEQALDYVRKALAGEMDGYDFARPVQPRLEPIKRHGRCHLCA
jgi:hypothetical protein